MQMMRSARVQFAAHCYFFTAACTRRLQFSTQIGQGDTDAYATRSSQRTHQLRNVQAPDVTFNYSSKMIYYLFFMVSLSRAQARKN